MKAAVWFALSLLAVATATAEDIAAPPALAPRLSREEADARVRYVNSLGMKFSPVGRVFFSIWPVRVQDYAAYLRHTELHNGSASDPGFKQTDTHPVVNVSWNDANVFCQWLTTRDRALGFLPATSVYRLPTDLEWSLAVGLPPEPNATPEERDLQIPDQYPWGTVFPPPAGAGNYCGEESGSDVAIAKYNDGFAWTSPVGSFPANALGLYDIGGNVSQWCLDQWNEAGGGRVLRGASWYNGRLKLALLSSCRMHLNPAERSDHVGFRVVRVDAAGRE